MTDQQRKIDGEPKPDAPPLHDPRHRAGLATRPENIAPYEAVMHATEGVTRRCYHEVKAALGKVTDSLTTMTSAHDELRSRRPEDRVVSADGQIRYVVPESRKAEFASALGQNFSRGAKHIDDANAVVESTFKSLTQQIDAALADPNRNQVSRAQNSAEIRTHVRALPDTERLNWASQQIEAGDHEVASAILGGSCWTSGLDKKQFEMLREQASTKFAPVAHAQRRALAAMSEKLATAGRVYLESFQSMVPRPNLVAARGDAAMQRLREGGK
jgi:hypothetical protein